MLSLITSTRVGILDGQACGGHESLSIGESCYMPVSQTGQLFGGKYLDLFFLAIVGKIIDELTSVQTVDCCILKV